MSGAPAPAASLACPACGAAAVAGDRFCEACGADLPPSEPAADGSAVPTGEETSATPAPEPDAPESPGCPSCGAGAELITDGYCGVCGMKLPAPRDHVEVELAAVAAVSDRGRRHHRNEDAFAVHEADGRVAAVVCDGVSSTVNPDLASQAAADAALEVLASACGDGVEDELVAAYSAAQRAVVAVAGEPQPPDLGWPSCTFLAGVVYVTGEAVLASAGDCRTFWLPANGEPATLTQDDSWAAEKIASGALSADEAYAHPLAHTITRWLGHDADPAWGPRVVRFTSSGGGRLVLCSDGLWNYARRASDIAAAGGGAGGVADQARRLVDFANERGGHDNVTVVVIAVDPQKGAPA